MGAHRTGPRGGEQRVFWRSHRYPCDGYMARALLQILDGPKRSGCPIRGSIPRNSSRVPHGGIGFLAVPSGLLTVMVLIWCNEVSYLHASRV